MEIIAVVKANAYGHGLIGCAQALADHVDFFGVANLEEAVALRAAVPHPIIILGPALPEERAGIAEAGFIPSISSWEEAQHFARVAQSNPVSINFKIDTGMGRMGVIEDEAIELFKKIHALEKIQGSQRFDSFAGLK